ncbi:MAG: UvrB/UvrC motif-containing protein [Candidatus Pacebacteria bacterium]|nr:UvrB/UvrC motif-containing protein [Candidatus Paceibacterota bacterium]
MSFKIFGRRNNYTIDSMHKNSSGFFAMEKFFVTRKNLLIASDIPVFNTEEEVYEYYGDMTMVAKVSCNEKGEYYFDFMHIFDQSVPLSDDIYDSLAVHDGFIRLSNSHFVVEEVEDNELDDEAYELVTRENLVKKMEEAVANENYEEAAKLKKQINNLFKL